MDKFSLNVWTAKLAIGSIWLVSIFLAVCGFYNIFPFVEDLASTTTWEVVVAIPILVIAYMMGAIVTYLGTMIYTRSPSSLIREFVSVCRSGSDFIVARHEEMRHELEFFQACVPTVVFLSLSVCWSSVRVLRSSPGEKWIAIGLSVLVLSTAPLTHRMATRIRKDMGLLASQVKEKEVSTA